MNDKVRSPARTLWSKHGSLFVMGLACFMSFTAGREWERRQTVDAVQAVMVQHKERQDLLEQKVNILASQYSVIAQRLELATENVAQAASAVQTAVETSNDGTKTKSEPEPERIP